MKINGPIEILYVVTALFIILTIMFLMGKGSWLIAGYNTSPEEEKELYDEKKLCRVMGGCFIIIDVLLLAICFFRDKMPEFFGYIFIGIVVADSLVAIILSNTICKKK